MPTAALHSLFWEQQAAEPNPPVAAGGHHRTPSFVGDHMTFWSYAPLLLTLGTLSCAIAPNRHNPDIYQPGEYKLTVDEHEFWTDWSDIPAAYHRIGDPIVGSAWGLRSGNRVCFVDAWQWTAAKDHDMFSCQWRFPR